MNNDITLIQNALNILNEKLGLVETEKFISLINRNSGFDYTKWREHLFEDMTVEELNEKAMDYYKNKYPEEFE